MTTDATILNADQVRQAFKARGVSIAAWAREAGFGYRAVTMVLSGRLKCNYGVGHRIAVALGMKAPPETAPPNQQAAA